jgi:hypothetical protein
LTFKQDISCNDIFVWEIVTILFFTLDELVVEDAVNHVFINGFIYEHHIIVRKKARKGLLLGEILAFMGHKHGWVVFNT